MKIAAIIAGLLVGGFFVSAGVVVLFNLVEGGSPPPPGSAAESFFAAFGPTGYLTFVKVLEIVGGLLVAIPKTRNLGLLILGPIIVNILAFHIFVTNWVGVADPKLIGICLLTLFLLWVERKAFTGLVNRQPKAF